MEGTELGLAILRQGGRGTSGRIIGLRLGGEERGGYHQLAKALEQLAPSTDGHNAQRFETSVVQLEHLIPAGLRKERGVFVKALRAQPRGDFWRPRRGEERGQVNHRGWEAHGAQEVRNTGMRWQHAQTHRHARREGGKKGIKKRRAGVDTGGAR